MKISKVESFLMSYPMPEIVRLPFYGGERTIVKRDAMLIRVTADNGLRGYAPGPAHERAAQEIQEQIGPFLEGKDPAQWRSFQLHADHEVLKTYHAVEVAVLDLAAKYEGCPLSELLGGRRRDRIRVYGSAGMYMSPERFAEEAAAIQALGYPAYKMRPALGPDEDVETVERMRAATGPDFGLMIDAHSWWRMGDLSYGLDVVLRLARSLARFNPVWLEEPLPPDDHSAYRDLTMANILPVATGEHEQEEKGFLDLIETQCAHVIQMDVCCQGGFRMAQRIFDAVEKAGLRFAFHSWGSDLEVLAAAQLGICREESVVEWLERPCYANFGKPGMYPFPLAEEILSEPLYVEHGSLVVPGGPGLGIEIDESVISRYPFIKGPWSYFKLDSPPETVAVTGDHSVKWIKG